MLKGRRPSTKLLGWAAPDFNAQAFAFLDATPRFPQRRGRSPRGSPGGAGPGPPRADFSRPDHSPARPSTMLEAATNARTGSTRQHGYGTHTSEPGHLRTGAGRREGAPRGKSDPGVQKRGGGSPGCSGSRPQKPSWNVRKRPRGPPGPGPTALGPGKPLLRAAEDGSRGCVLTAGEVVLLSSTHVGQALPRTKSQGSAA